MRQLLILRRYILISLSLQRLIKSLVQFFPIGLLIISSTRLRIIRLIGGNPRLVKLLIYLIRVSSYIKVSYQRYLEATAQIESVQPRYYNGRLSKVFVSLRLSYTQYTLALRGPFAVYLIGGSRLPSYRFLKNQSQYNSTTILYFILLQVPIIILILLLYKGQRSGINILRQTRITRSQNRGKTSSTLEGSRDS